MSGTLDILNCGAGHLTFKFNKEDKKEVANAKKAITDMLKRGYTILITTEDGGTERVKDFDPDTDEYIIAAQPKEKKPKRIPMERAKATGVGRTAGG